MTERFNFFDIYVYLLPGLLAILVFSAPFWVIAGWSPPHDLPLSQDISGVAAALVVAYIIGHLLYILSERGLPSTIHIVSQERDTASKDVHPSHLLLDRFPFPTQLQLRSAVKAHFNLDIFHPEPAARNAARTTAFFLCRSFIHHHDGAAYSEQFQGLYNLTRQASMACALGAFVFTGWSIARDVGDVWSCALAWATPIALLMGIGLWWHSSWSARRVVAPGKRKEPKKRSNGLSKKLSAVASQVCRCTDWAPALQRPFWYCAGVLCISAGFNCAAAALPRAYTTWHGGAHPAWWLAPGCALVLFTLAFALRRANLEFTRAFASAVYNDFLAITSESGSGIASSARPIDMVQIKEGEAFTVPPHALFVLTGLGMNDYPGVAQLLVNTTVEVANHSSPASFREAPSIAHLPAGFTAVGGSVIEVRSTGTNGSGNAARAWGYLVGEW